MTTDVSTADAAILKSSMVKSPCIEAKIDSLTADALPYFNSIFKQLALATVQNAEIL
jgi:hypothetical protein